MVGGGGGGEEGGGGEVLGEGGLGQGGVGQGGEGREHAQGLQGVGGGPGVACG